MDINYIKKNIEEFENQKDFSIFLEDKLLDIQSYFESQNTKQLGSIKFDIEDIIYDLVDNQLIFKEDNSSIINAFLILLAELFEELKLTSAIIEIIEYLPKNISISKRLNAVVLYSKVNDISCEYHNKFEKIISLIDESREDEQFKYKPIYAVIYFYLQVIQEFKRTKQIELYESFKELFCKYSDKYFILNDNTIIDILSSISINSDDTKISLIKDDLKKNKIQQIYIEKELLPEISNYSKKLNEYPSLTFNEIFRISKDYIDNYIEDEKKVHYSLKRGVKILDEDEELYQYIKSFGKMHKVKLYSSFDKVISKFNHKTINVLDWGCGQALATSLLIDYIKEKDLNIDISNIILIEPSSLALSRGLLHIDVLKSNDIDIKAINKDIDSLEIKDLIIDNSNITLHLFSNILDVEFFRLDREFLHKISSSQKGFNYFLCVSPNINDKRNTRLDMFYKYFDDNFETELISDRSSDIKHYRRYEKVFLVKNYK